MNGYGGCVTVWCHIVSAGYFVNMFACVDIIFWKPKVSPGLKEYSMVHASEGSFEVGISRVDVFFYILTSSYIIACVDRLSYIFLCRLNLSVVSLSIHCASAHGEPISVRIEVHSLSMPFTSVIDL